MIAKLGIRLNKELELLTKNKIEHKIEEKNDNKIISLINRDLIITPDFPFHSPIIKDSTGFYKLQDWTAAMNLISSIDLPLTELTLIASNTLDIVFYLVRHCFKCFKYSSTLLIFFSIFK